MEERLENAEDGLVTRRVNIRKADYEEHGFTEDCSGCTRMQDGRAKRPHTKRCSDRMMEALGTTEAGRARIRAGVDRRNAEVVRRNAAPAQAEPALEPPAAPVLEGMEEDNLDDDAMPPMDQAAQDVVMGRLRLDRDEGAGGMLLKMVATGPGGVDIMEI